MTQEFLDQAASFFKSLPVKEVTSEFKNGDKLFQKFGVGNHVEAVSEPYEKIVHNETLLSLFKSIDPIKYQNLHKGTPFYFLAWLNFDIQNYSKGMFYFDAAIAEDSIHREHWKIGVAMQLYTLEFPNHMSNRTVDKIAQLLDKQLLRFASLPHVSKNVNRNSFIDDFVKVILNDNDVTKRSLISAIYVFLLEFDDLFKLLAIRTTHGGSTLPFLTHLFTGGAIFESLLKQMYPATKTGSLSTIFKSKIVKNDFGLGSIQMEQSAASLSDILTINKNNSVGHLRSFSITSQLRNTTGHDVVWDDIFNDPENYKTLFEHEMNAILHVIDKNYLSKS